MTNRELLQTSVEHYNRMIAWAKEQPKHKVPDGLDMADAIDEHWLDTYCVLCETSNQNDCSDCVLENNGQRCSNDNSLWDKMNRSKTWETWVKRATKLRNFMKALQRRKNRP